MKLALAFTALATLPVSLGMATSLHPEPQVHVGLALHEGSLCAAGEQVVYSCLFPRGTGSVCRGANTLHYRFGHPGHVDVDIANAPDWHNVHTGGVIGGGGGGEQHIRFTNGATHYVVFDGEMGSLTDHPGRHFSGIAVVVGPDGKKELATLNCKGHAQIARDGLTGALHSLRSGPDEETQDGPFDAWF